MALLIGFLTFILVLNCLLLILLVLVQLPKKEAGAGLAFGGGASDALFGAGSGNALTKLTKFAAGTFLGMALVLTVLYAQLNGTTSKTIAAKLAKHATAAPLIPTAAPAKPGNAFTPLSTNLPAPTVTVLGTNSTAPIVSLQKPTVTTSAPAPVAQPVTPPAQTPVPPK